ncbi:MAG: serine hydrolase [Sphingobacteriales bacterium 41-5]|nr:MAG: serine hydrolase [Sphingobacteriales bacterium 41-5]
MQKLLFGMLLFICFLASAQKTDQKLEKKINQAIKGFNGDIGIFVKDLKSGKTVAINADTIFPTASIVKVPILMGITDKIMKGQYAYDSTVAYDSSYLYRGEDILGEFKDSGLIRIKKLIMLMLTTSDNTASLWLQALSGTGTRINQILDSLGYKSTRVNSRTPGREVNRSRYGWGQTTPREIAGIIESIYRTKIFTPYYCDIMMRSLGRNYWDEDEGISVIPPYIEVFSKNGCVNQTRNEVMLVNAPNRPYILSIFTKNNKDQSWRHDNEAWALTRKISTLLWDYFEPKDKWIKPSKN